MKGLLARALPERIATQLVSLLIGTVLVAHIVLTVYFLWSRMHGEHGHPAETTGRIAALVELLDRTDRTERARLLEAMARSHPQFAFRPADAEGEGRGAEEPSPDREFLQRALGGGFAVSAAAREAGDMHRALVVTLRDGQRLRLASPPPVAGPPVGIWLATILFVLLGIALFSIWAARALIRPLEAVAAAAERYGPSTPPAALREEGPREIRTLAAAFNRMQSRIAELVRERTDAFAAVGHDLRTPVTRLRLRAEYIPDPRERNRMIDDLDQIDGLVASAMRHLRDEAAAGDRVVFDLATLLQTVVDRFADMARDVPFTPAGKVTILGDPLAIERAVTNLVDNAFKHGGSARLSLTVAGNQALVDVLDSGPGIAAEEQDRLLQPFVRGDDARTMHPDAGFGLGLAIARKIATAHGGALSFPSVAEGFAVRLALPLERHA